MRPQMLVSPQRLSAMRARWIKFFVAALSLAQLAPPTQAQRVASPRETLVLADVTIIDGSGKPAQPRRTIVIADERIVAIYRAGSKRTPAGATVLNLRG